MPSNVRLVGNESPLSTASNGNTFFDATLIRVLNTSSSNQVITLYLPNDEQYGNTTIKSEEIIYLAKRYEDKIKSSNASVLGTPIGYTA